MEYGNQLVELRRSKKSDIFLFYRGGESKELVKRQGKSALEGVKRVEDFYGYPIWRLEIYVKYGNGNSFGAGTTSDLDKPFICIPSLQERRLNMGLPLLSLSDPKGSDWAKEKTADYFFSKDVAHETAHRYNGVLFPTLEHCGYWLDEGLAEYVANMDIESQELSRDKYNNDVFRPLVIKSFENGFVDFSNPVNFLVNSEWNNHADNEESLNKIDPYVLSHSFLEYLLHFRGLEQKVRSQESREKVQKHMQAREKKDFDFIFDDLLEVKYEEALEQWKGWLGVAA